MPPAKSRNRTPPKPFAREQLGELLRAGEAAHARGQVRVRLAAGQDAAEQRDDPVEPERGRTARAAPRGVVISRIAEPAAGTEHAAQLADPRLEVLDVADPEADDRRVEARVLERQREHVALDQLELGRLAPGALEHRLGEVERRRRWPRPGARRRSRGRPCRSTRRARGRRAAPSRARSPRASAGRGPRS